MSQSRKLILLTAILIILCGSLVAVRFINENKEEEKVDTEDTVYISQIPKEDIVHLSLVNEKGQFDFEYTTDWKMVGYEEYEIKTYVANDFQSLFSNLKANRVIEEVTEETDLSKYGLENPTASVTATLKDGTIKTLAIGNKTPEGNSYYTLMANDPTIYTIASFYCTYVNYGIDDFRDDKVVNIDTANVASLYIKLNGKEPIEIVPNTKPDSLSTHVMKQPYKETKLIDTYSFDEFLQGFPTITIDKYIEDNSQDIKKYGLDVPKLELRFESNPDDNGDIQQGHYLFGDTFTEDGEEYIYFKKEDNNNIYAMKAKDLLDKMDIEPFELVDHLIYIVNILDVNHINITGFGKEYTIDIENEVTTTTNDDGTTNEETNQTYYLNGKKVDDTQFKDMYQLIIGLTADFEIRKQIDLNTDNKVSIKYSLNDGSKKDINYYPYNDNFFIYEMEDGLYYAVSSDEIEFMFEMLQALENNEWSTN